MINTIFTSISNIFTTMWTWIININNELPFLTIALGVFLVYQLSRFYILPMFKGGFNSGSDSVKKRKENDD